MIPPQAVAISLYNDLLKVIHEYDEAMLLTTVLGVLELVKIDLIASQGIDNEHT